MPSGLTITSEGSPAILVASNSGSDPGIRRYKLFGPYESRMIPSSPGGLGVVHYLTILTLSLWAVGATQALAFALLFHGVPYLLVVGLGAYFLFREGLKLTTLRRSAERARTPKESPVVQK